MAEEHDPQAAVASIRIDGRNIDTSGLHAAIPDSDGPGAVGFRDALESMVLALNSRGIKKHVIQEALAEVLDAYGNNDLTDARIEIALNVFDEDGIVVDTTSVLMTPEAVTDVVNHAVQLIELHRAGNAEAFDDVVAELEEALCAADVLDREAGDGGQDGNGSNKDDVQDASGIVLAEPPFSLNEAQLHVLRVYQLGEFEPLAQVGSQAELDSAMVHCGDGLLRYLMVELSTKEDCMSLKDACSRIGQTVNDLQTLAYDMVSESWAAAAPSQAPRRMWP